MTNPPLVPVGPYGMADIVYMGFTKPMSPLRAYAKTTATRHTYMLVVEDFYNKFADAWFNGTEAELPLAEQWLLDMCNVLYGGEV